jgi:hypothetical protein
MECLGENHSSMGKPVLCSHGRHALRSASFYQFVARWAAPVCFQASGTGRQYGK